MFSRSLCRLLLAVSLGLGPFAYSAGAFAEYALPDIELVPIQRIVTNLQKRADQAMDANREVEFSQLSAQMGRALALAYAQRAEELQVDTESGFVFEGPGWTPAIPKMDDGGEPTLTAEGYLRFAGVHYAAATVLNPTDMRSRLGYAWVLEEIGDTERAIEEYREIFAATWPDDRDLDALEFGARPLSQEAALQLIGLLDPQKDAAEIAKLELRSAQLDDIDRWITPIVIPLEDDLIFEALIDPTAAVAFDLDGTGRNSRWRWITPQAAWLVWDPAGEGRIESGLQLFGAVTFWLFWDNGYDALAALDDNGDGELVGPELSGLALWRDTDGDGRSNSSEVRPLEEWGITGLSTAQSTHRLGFPYNPAGVILEDGRRRASYDWILSAVPAQLSARP